jgi:hypothetical protein
MAIGEGDKVQANKLMKYQMDVQQQQALRQAGIGNVFGGATDIGAGLMQYGNYQNANSQNAKLLELLGKK